MRFSRSVFVILFATALLIAHLAWSDPAPVALAPAVPLSLQDALKALPEQSLPQDTLFLTVGAEAVRPAPIPRSTNTTGEASYENAVAPPPPDPSTLDGILTIYGRSYQPFEKVVAIAPPTMTILNTDPSLLDMDPISLAPGNAIKILLGSLTAAQWQQIASGGLSISDLDDAQSALFRAAVRMPLKVVPSTNSWDPPFGQPGFDYQQYQQDYDSHVQTITEDMLAGARLEAHLATMYLLPVPNVTQQEWYDEPGSSGIPGVYQIKADDSYQPDQNPLSALIRADVPNTLKASNLNWNSRPLGVTVPIDGVKTVDDLVGRVAKATGLELYCEPAYASRSVLILDTTGRPQKARDLLRGLCVCVCGAWRQVGPAYVLTDDIAGLSSRRAFLKEIANAWNNKINKLTNDANNTLIDRDWTKSLQFFPDDPDALTPDQLKTLQDKASGPNSGNDWLDLSYSQIPTGAQSALKDKFTRMGGNGDSDFSHIASALGPDYKMNADVQVRVYLDIPSLGLVALDTGTYFNDFRKRKFGGSQPPTPPAGKTPEKPALTAQTAGVLCALRSADEARAMVDEMAKLGLSFLYCDVFANGKAFIANSAIPPASDDAANVLHAAIDEGKKKGVKVVAVIDTFAWGQGDLKAHLDPLPLGVAEDQSVTLESASSALRQRAAEQTVTPNGPQPVAIVQWVSPADPVVQGDLTQLVNAIVRTPGLGGLAFEDTAPPSYLTNFNVYDQQSVALGYTLGARLDFLRAHHADPIDFGDEDQNFFNLFVGDGIGGGTVQMDIPSFDDNGPGTNMQPLWDKARKQADLDAMARLYWAARSVNPTLPLYLRGSFNDFNFSPWLNPTLPGDLLNQNFEPSRFPEGSSMVLDLGQLGTNLNGLSFIIPYLNSTLAKAKYPVNVLFSLARNPSPDGPLRDLDVIAEHVRFTQVAPAAKGSR